MRFVAAIAAGIVAIAVFATACGGDSAKPLGQRVTDPAAVQTSTPISNPNSNPVTYQIRGDVVSTTGGSGTVPAGSSPTPSRSNTTHTVASGDTCADIAGKFSISVDDLKKANRTINSDCSNLKVGDVLKIQSTVTPVATGPTPRGSGREYTVKEGDNCGSIAANQGVDVEKLIQNNTKEAAILLDEALSRSGHEPPATGLDIAAIRTEFNTEFASEFKGQIAYLDAIRSAMAEDDIFVDEMTQMGYAARFALPVLTPRSFVTSSYQGTLGYGFATALGAQVAAAPRRVISVNGDGGFLFTMPELATAVQHNIPLIAIVFSDGHYGNVRRIQKAMYGGRTIASDLHNPDFVKLAEAFGATGMRATNPGELGQALAAARQIDGPVLIEVPVDGDAIPSAGKYLYGRKVR